MKIEKNKSIQLLLALIVLVIWVGVFFRVKKLKDSPENYSRQIARVNTIEKTTLEIRDTLYLNYEDPFLKRNTKAQKANSQKRKSGLISNKVIPNKSNVSITKKIEETTKELENVNYYGCVGGEKEPIGFLKLQEKLFVLKIGDELKELKVLKIDTELLFVEYYNKIYSVGKHKEGKSVIKQVKAI